jgi:3-(methylsulfanyl)propanoyl-CoA dehydrogenase
MPYAAPLADMRFVLEELASLGSGEPEEPVPSELLETILGAAARFAESILDPLNEAGDRVGSILENGIVRTPPGFQEAYRRYIEAGWNSLTADPSYGGQGLPFALSSAVAEMWNSAATSFALCPLLNIGAVTLLEAHGSPEQKEHYLKKLVSGEWTGTMNLTEPQAGTDLGALRTRANPEEDHYRINGQKIFITYGDHDLAPNIVHMVLARTSGATPGTKGLSLFLVPKFLPDPEGSPGAQNGVKTLRLEKKLGIHASPTCVLLYEDAIGWRIGEEGRGLESMFTMMNNARVNVGLQGVGIAERAYQRARDFARERVQGRPITAPPEDAALPILHHPDVRRMLLFMRAACEATRALSYYAAALIDRSRTGPDAKACAARADLLIPVVKAWCTDLAVAVASEGIQVHGGMGYIEETGAAQYLRDARIAPIYEGTNGIQAQDLVLRKLARDRGAAAYSLAAEMRATERALRAAGASDLCVIASFLGPAIAAFETATRELACAQAARAAAGSYPYLELFGIVAAGWLLARLALAATGPSQSRRGDGAFLTAKRMTARFYAEHFLALAPGLLTAAGGGESVLDFPLDLL